MIRKRTVMACAALLTFTGVPAYSSGVMEPETIPIPQAPPPPPPTPAPVAPVIIDVPRIAPVSTVISVDQNNLDCPNFIAKIEANAARVEMKNAMQTTQVLPAIADFHRAIASIATAVAVQPQSNLNMAFGNILMKLNGNGALVLFSGADQTFSDGSNGYQFMGTSGSLMTHVDGTLALVRGKFLSKTDSKELSLKIPNGSLEVSPNSLALVEILPGSKKRIAIVDGKCSLVINGSSIPMKKGEQLVLSDMEEELIPIDGSVEQVIGSIRIQKKSVDTNQLISHQFASNNVLDLTARLSRRSSSVRNDKPVKPLVVLAREGTEIAECNDRVLRINSGAIFVSANESQIIATPLCQVKVGKNGLVSLETDGETARVRACSGPGHLQVYSSGNVLPLIPGQELFLSAKAPHQSDILPRDGIGRRHLVAHGLRRGTVAVVGDFSIPSFLGTAIEIQPVRRGEIPAYQDLFTRLLKTAATVQIVTNYRGQYYLPPAMTAAR